LLEDIEDFLKKNKANITVDGVYNSPGMWVDSAGGYFVHGTEAGSGTRESDGTLPIPPPSP